MGGRGLSGKELNAGIERVGAQDGGRQESLGREQPESTTGPAVDLTEQGINFHGEATGVLRVFCPSVQINPGYSRAEKYNNSEKSKVKT